MKIFTLAVHEKLQPRSTNIIYPQGNADFGVEQDFWEYLQRHRELVTNDPKRADWHYLPIFWTRWHLNHDYGKKGLDKLAVEFEKSVINPEKTFTICQYARGPIIDIKNVLLFLSSRTSRSGRDVPLLRNSIRKLRWFRPSKRYIASFIGRIETHPIRSEMINRLEGVEDVLIENGDVGLDIFRNTVEQSFVSLCPRGIGGNSFRFYESMELGAVPCLISDIDVRPFKNIVDWNKCSLYVKEPKNLLAVIRKHDTETLLAMGRNAQQIYRTKLRYSKWCECLLKELALISSRTSERKVQ